MDSLSQLRDIHLPKAISIWPPAPGWWFLVIIIALIICGAVIWWRKYQRRNHARKQALACVQMLENRYQNKDVDGIIMELSMLLRRVSLAYFPRDQVAGLQGAAWLQFLDDVGGTHEFAHGRGRVFIDEPYRNQTTVELTPLFQLVRQWLNALKINSRHRAA